MFDSYESIPASAWITKRGDPGHQSQVDMANLPTDRSKEIVDTVCEELVVFPWSCNVKRGGGTDMIPAAVVFRESHGFVCPRNMSLK